MSFGSWNIQSEEDVADYIQNKAGAEFKQKRDHGQQPSQFGGSQFDRSGGIKVSWNIVILNYFISFLVG